MKKKTTQKTDFRLQQRTSQQNKQKSDTTANTRSDILESVLKSKLKYTKTGQCYMCGKYPPAKMIAGTVGKSAMAGPVICERCNRNKNDKEYTIFQFKKWISKIHTYLKKVINNVRGGLAIEKQR